MGAGVLAECLRACRVARGAGSGAAEGVAASARAGGGHRRAGATGRPRAQGCPWRTASTRRQPSAVAEAVGGGAIACREAGGRRGRSRRRPGRARRHAAVARVTRTQASRPPPARAGVIGRPPPARGRGGRPAIRRAAVRRRRRPLHPSPLPTFSVATALGAALACTGSLPPFFFLIAHSPRRWYVLDRPALETEGAISWTLPMVVGGGGRRGASGRVWASGGVAGVRAARGHCATAGRGGRVKPGRAPHWARVVPGSVRRGRPASGRGGAWLPRAVAAGRRVSGRPSLSCRPAGFSPRIAGAAAWIAGTDTRPGTRARQRGREASAAAARRAAHTPALGLRPLPLP